MKQEMVIVAEEDLVNHGGTTSRNGQASHCRHCCASQTTEAYGRQLQQRRLSEYSNDAWALRELVLRDKFSFEIKDVEILG